MRAWNILLGAGAATVAAVAVLLGGALSAPGTGSPASPQAETRTHDDRVASLLAGLATGDAAQLARELEARVGTDPDDGAALAVLGLVYQQQARETGDPSFYGLAARALERAGNARGSEATIALGRSALANARHRFAEGLRLARRAVRLEPKEGSAHGALGDALLGLGRYREAFASYDRMAALAPGIPAYARVAHARVLLGRTAEAVEAYEIALETGPLVPEYVAWATVQLGNVHFDAGNLVAAERAYRRAQRSRPGYVHAEAALARVDAARGHYARSARRLRIVVEALPVPAYAILLADVLHAAGRVREARQAERLVRALQRLLEANGVRTELQTALFDLDRDRNVRDALRRARLAHASAPDVHADDALAWALFRAGRCSTARASSQRALRLGTNDALAFFHRGMIERCLGSPSAHTWFKRALRANPHFSLRFAPTARAALAVRS